jgi:hypothetical protein
VDGGELLCVFFAQILMLKLRVDLSSFKPERGGPFCFATTVAELVNSRVDRLDFGVELRRRHPTIVYPRRIARRVVG